MQVAVTSVIHGIAPLTRVSSERERGLLSEAASVFVPCFLSVACTVALSSNDAADVKVNRRKIACVSLSRRELGCSLVYSLMLTCQASGTRSASDAVVLTTM